MRVWATAGRVDAIEYANFEGNMRLSAPVTAVTSPQWVEVLVDCPGAQGIFTYQLPAHLKVQPGDILSVPFGPQQVGAIAIQLVAAPPVDVDVAQVRAVESVVSAGFFPPTYWALLHQVADYYVTPLMAVVRVALPPGLLARSQRRVRLAPEREERAIRADGAAAQLPMFAPSDDSRRATEPELTPTAQKLLQLLQASKTGDYAWRFVQQQVKGAARALPELLQQGWVESYLAPPQPVQPKLRQAVILVGGIAELTNRQQEILDVLKRQGGDVWLSDLLQLCRTTTPTLRSLAQKGCLVIEPREVLRSELGPEVVAAAERCLTPDQALALQQIQAQSGFAQLLLHGVTGSGKTEVYLQAIAPVLQQGKSALVLVPEIGLTPQLTDRFRARFGPQVGVYHSALSAGERYDTWRQLLSGGPQVVIGTRSAIFLPLPHLGLIVLDEEHDPSFKQDQPAPCYHARTVAQWRAQLAACPLILGSATPALESWVAAGQADGPGDGASHYLALPQRIYDQPLPTVDVVDMRQELKQGNGSIFSRSLQAALHIMQAQGQQGLLFIHRRGHSTFVSCRSCGYVMECPHCDVSLSYHHVHAEAQPLLRCHYCNFGQLQPDHCPACESAYFKNFGSGTQRVTQELAKHFPSLRVLRFDSDTTRAKGAHRALLTRFAEGEADVLVGTQMLTKGLDLTQVTLVGIVAADGLLNLANFRAGERAFQTLVQVAGRAGRGTLPGRVILQTYAPDHAVVAAVQRQIYAPFAAAELHQRRALGYPPYGKLILLRLSSLNAMAVQAVAQVMAQTIATAAPQYPLLGPAPASILRIANRYRWQILLKLPPEAALNLFDWSGLRSLCGPSVSLTIDVDPLEF
jgi:primosomal protein N' (replication factor Y) (superfamily II helicase)